MARDEGGAEDSIGSLLDVNLEESLVLAVENCSIHLRQFESNRLNVDALVAGVFLMRADVRDFGVGVGTPGNRQRAGLGTAEEKGVLDGNGTWASDRCVNLSFEQTSPTA